MEFKEMLGYNQQNNGVIRPPKYQISMVGLQPLHLES
jgi:hypothetical protein